MVSDCRAKTGAGVLLYCHQTPISSRGLTFKRGKCLLWRHKGLLVNLKFAKIYSNWTLKSLNWIQTPFCCHRNCHSTSSSHLNNTVQDAFLAIVMLVYLNFKLIVNYFIFILNRNKRSSCQRRWTQISCRGVLQVCANALRLWCYLVWRKKKQDSCSKYALSKIDKKPVLFCDVLWIWIQSHFPGSRFSFRKQYELLCTTSGRKEVNTEIKEVCESWKTEIQLTLLSVRFREQIMMLVSGTETNPIWPRDTWQFSSLARVWGRAEMDPGLMNVTEALSRRFPEVQEIQLCLI